LNLFLVVITPRINLAMTIYMSGRIMNPSILYWYNYTYSYDTVLRNTSNLNQNLDRLLNDKLTFLKTREIADRLDRNLKQL